MTTTFDPKYPATKALLDEAAGYPSANGATGFMYSSDELAALLTEMSKRVTVGVHDVHNDGPSCGMQITVYVTFDRTEYEIEVPA
jgi:hypothetical protein